MIASMLCSIFELEHTNNVHRSHACSNFEPLAATISCVHRIHLNENKTLRSGTLVYMLLLSEFQKLLLDKHTTSETRHNQAGGTAPRYSKKRQAPRTAYPRNIPAITFTLTSPKVVLLTTLAARWAGDCCKNDMFYNTIARQ